MKKLGIVLMLAAFVCGGVFAQSSQTTISVGQLVQVSGNLVYLNDHIAVKENGKTYYLEGIQHLVGFVDGLKEGAGVKAEGYAQPTQIAPEYVFLKLTNVTFNGKSYSIAPKAEKEPKQEKKHR